MQQNAEPLNHWLHIRGGSEEDESSPKHTITPLCCENWDDCNNVVQVLYQEHCLATPPGSPSLPGIKGRAGPSPMGQSPDPVNAK